MSHRPLTRRTLLAGIAAAPALAAPSLALGQSVRIGPFDQPRNFRNTSSFRMIDWRDHFNSLGRATIVCDTQSKALHFWSGDGGTYRLYPTSVPLTEDLTKRGYTKVVRKKVGPSWTPTENMRKRNPNLPAFMPPGPGNPLGTHAMYLSWPAYLIHGTHDTRKIGRPASSGCIGLYNEQVAELFSLVPVGTQVRLI